MWPPDLEPAASSSQCCSPARRMAVLFFSAIDALRFIKENHRMFLSGVRKGIFRRSQGIFRRMFGESTLRDAIKPVLVPCYDLSSGTPFVFSRADAVEADVFDFLIGGVCAATCAEKKAVEVGSVAEGRAKIQAIGGGVAMRNPMAMAITHVMNNKTEFPFAAGVEDMLAISFGCNEAYGARSPKSASELVKIAGDGAADMVDQAVAMAFKQKNRENSYVRIQGQSQGSKKGSTAAAAKIEEEEEFLRQRSVDSVMFRGRKTSEKTNSERLQKFTAELIAEERWRKSSPLPTVLIKPAVTPRTSSATNSTTFTTLSASSLC
ncbi:hypothetical protein HPP92_026343 [Vanilla planifolia]|uniref:PNPLA domain-containing protein n=1 Tax=Vanilla planifolia TaxID=51239 RepID=A0A835PGC9_VANPL|nr:hypothetical protein HPP92_026343 [Vanilla planifolia]